MTGVQTCALPILIHGCNLYFLQSPFRIINFERVSDRHIYFLGRLGHGPGSPYSSYLRLIGSDGHVSVSLVFAKSAVNPIKAVTVPRLELTAAVLAAL